MQKYLNKSRNSGVIAYELGSDFIRVKFIDGTVYRYTAAAIGSDYFNKMIILAQRGQGLSTFISQYIKKNFSEKED